MDVSQFDFSLPDELVALRPAGPRDSARMLVVDEHGGIEHAIVRDLPRFLRPRDTLVLNNTRVFNARLRGTRKCRGNGLPAKIEILLHRRLGPDRFAAFARPARKLVPGDRLTLGRSIDATVVRRGEAGEVELSFAIIGAVLDAAIAVEGETPLPPYIIGKRNADERDVSDYQTIYASADGSVAAPTAGLHFTPELFDELTAAGVGLEAVTLHVGPGTFLPVTVADTADHKMHSEHALLSDETARRLNAVRAADARIVAVGTTSLRTIESAAVPGGTLAPFRGETNLFIKPGYHFRCTDVLLTNFHLPRSTLFMLVCAFSGTETMKRAYAEAIQARYRFFSYGDACLLFRRLV